MTDAQGKLMEHTPLSKKMKMRFGFHQLMDCDFMMLNKGGLPIA